MKPTTNATNVGQYHSNGQVIDKVSINERLRIFRGDTLGKKSYNASPCVCCVASLNINYKLDHPKALVLGRVLNFSGEDGQSGQLVLDEVQEWSIEAELRRDDHHPGHHDHAGGGRGLRSFLVDLDEGFLDDAGDVDLVGVGDA